MIFSGLSPTIRQPSDHKASTLPEEFSQRNTGQYVGLTLFPLILNFAAYRQLVLIRYSFKQFLRKVVENFDRGNNLGGRHND